MSRDRRLSVSVYPSGKPIPVGVKTCLFRQACAGRSAGPFLGLDVTAHVYKDEPCARAAMI
jgi:hypothetical protein